MIEIVHHIVGGGVEGQLELTRLYIALLSADIFQLVTYQASAQLFPLP